MEATCLTFLNLQIWFHLQVQHFDTRNLAIPRGSHLRAMRFEVTGKKPISSYFYQAVLQVLWSTTFWKVLLSEKFDLLKGIKMEKAFPIFSDESNYHKVNSFQKREKNPKDLDVGLCCQIPAGRSVLVSPHTTRKFIGWTSKSFLIPHFRSLEINFIINLEAWFNCTNYIFSWELMDYYLPSSCCM